MDKVDIDEAIDIAAKELHQDWQFYLFCLSPEEETEAVQEIKDALKTLKQYGISNDAIAKHRFRKDNKEDPPIRFIDRPHFIRVETDELPF